MSCIRYVADSGKESRTLIMEHSKTWMPLAIEKVGYKNPTFHSAELEYIHFDRRARLIIYVLPIAPPTQEDARNRPSSHRRPTASFNNSFQLRPRRLCLAASKSRTKRKRFRSSCQMVARRSSATGPHCTLPWPTSLTGSPSIRPSLNEQIFNSAVLIDGQVTMA